MIHRTRVLVSDTVSRLAQRGHYVEDYLAVFFGLAFVPIAVVFVPLLVG